MTATPLIRSAAAIRRGALALGGALSFACMQLSGVALALIVAICSVNVVARYVFNHAISWAEEAMVFSMIFTIFMASAAVTWQGKHMYLDMLMRRFSRQFQRWTAVLTALASAALLFWLASISFEVVSRLYRYAQLSDALEIPMWIPQSFVMAGLFLNGLMMVLRIVAHDPVPPVQDFTAEEAEL